ncbi:MAG TPA: nitrite reductase large subunit NirB [Propionibacteriaceae bacterium]|nr:nitrite reductase large subunit NirB [Propionibacteriaceae bacterium]
MRNQDIVILGGGPAAHRCVEALQARLADADLPADALPTITLLTEEPYAPYDRVALSRRLVGTDDLTLGDRQLWEAPNIALRLGERAVGIDRVSQVVSTASGADYRYDQLVLATGSFPLLPPLEGADLCRVYRTIDDVESIRVDLDRLTTSLGRAPRVLVAGGGLLGLEAAGGVKDLGAEPTVVNAAGWLMNTQLDEGAGQALGRLITAQGLPVLLDVYPARVIGTGEPGAVTSVELSDGRLLDMDMVIFAIGVRPRDELGRLAELEIGERGGVVINEACRSSDDAIYAIGEVASFDGRCVGLVAPAYTMAEVCADRLLGGGAVFDGFDTATKLKLSGVDVASFGDAMGDTPGSLSVVYADPARGLYQKVVVTDDARTLLGGAFVGDASAYGSLRPLLGRELPSEPGAYLASAGASAAQAELPDDAIICSCNNVTLGTVRNTVNGVGCDACTDLGELKACTRAGTGCGSCVPLLKKTLEAELVKNGQTVSRALCEHFAMSRQELFDSIRVLGLTSFDEIVSRFGQGHGCDVCKPVVASILASQRSDYILDGGRGGLQDTNDRAMANMQKDGTYSVVPRIPGGEITPEKLAVIAAVALEFGLYTKITGGQRIDLFGARLEQLPEIWRKLVDAGFESGHAYGKSLRTVKSCVGSTWCRFGVQDSVAMAIELELRYRGLRSPHKLKLGVSGCARECAEARGKDVGVIATEAGWNMYVGGNGGFTPAHAQLFASDLDDATLIRYIDRFLMYYVRTADRLQRTARWIEDIDGGLEHVRDVVVHDALGIADDLDAAMASHVDRYEDEWAATLADPERLRRFRSFVNAPTTPDPNVVHVSERDQVRPATDAERMSTAVMIAGPSIGRRPEDPVHA